MKQDDFQQWFKKQYGRLPPTKKQLVKMAEEVGKAKEKALTAEFLYQWAIERQGCYRAAREAWEEQRSRKGKP